MAKKILLVGHCGPDSSYLRMAVRQAHPDAAIIAADDGGELNEKLADNVDLVLFNRELGYGFEPNTGVDMIRALRAAHPGLKMMLVSNYPDAQAAAEAAGALKGFGKREIGSPKVSQVLQAALK